MSNLCSICLKPDEILLKCTEIDSNNVTLLSKLSSSVPEVEWPVDCLICNQCKNQLNVVHSFRELCIKSRCKLEDGGDDKQHSVHNIVDEGSLDVENTIEESSSDEKFTKKSSIDELPVYDNYKCVECDLAFDERDFLYKHYKWTHKFEKPYICIVCDKNFKLRSHLKRHEMLHLNQRKYRCELCDRSYNMDSILRAHRIIDKSTRKYKCDHCGYSCTTKSNLEQHNTKLRDVFICYHCNKEFNSKDVLAQHIKSHMSLKRSLKSCPTCGTSYINQTILENHMRKEHGIGNTKLTYKTKQFPCDKCGKLYTTLPTMQSHNVSCDGIRRHSTACTKFRCGLCKKYYMTLKILKSHEKKCVSSENDNKSSENVEDVKKILIEIDKTSSTYEHSCELCPETFYNGSLFKEHIVEVHKQDVKVFKPFKCMKCSNRYVRIGSLQAHLRQHDNPSGNICSYCGKYFKKRSDLNVHEPIHLNMRTSRCEICDKGFNTYKNLRTHNLIKHRDPNTWKHHCNVCDRKFPIKSSFDQHMRRHMGQKPFICHVCQKPFVTKDELSRHINSHSNFRAFQCHLCDKEYKEKQVLQLHLKRVHDIGNRTVPNRVRRHVCSFCPKAFPDKNKLKRHLCTHTGERPFGCDLCEKKFTDKSYLKQHLKSAHNICQDNSA